MTQEQFLAFERLYTEYEKFRFVFALEAIEEEVQYSSLWDLVTYNKTRNFEFAELWLRYDPKNPTQYIKVIKKTNRTLTVEDLIKELQKYDMDTEIYTRSSEDSMSTSDIDIALLDDGRLSIYGF